MKAFGRERTHASVGFSSFVLHDKMCYQSVFHAKKLISQKCWLTVIRIVGKLFTHLIKSFKTPYWRGLETDKRDLSLEV